MTDQKPVILTFVRYYLPGYRSGGPVRTIANMVEALGDEFEFRIVTADRDKFDGDPYSGIDMRKLENESVKLGSTMFPKIGRGYGSGRNSSKSTPHDLIYFNSLYAPWYSLMPLLAIKLMEVF